MTINKENIGHGSILFILITAFCIPLAFRWDLIGPEEAIRSHDLLTVYSHYAFLRKAILEWHEFPLRNPYFGGGFPIIASPEDFTFTPFTIIVLPFGEAGGIRISIYLLHLFGAWGMFYLCRRVLELSPSGAIFSAVTLSLSDFLKSKMWNGFFIQTHYFLFPWIFAFYQRGREDRRYLVPCALIMSMVLMDSKYVVPTMFLFLVIWAVIASLKTGRDGFGSVIWTIGKEISGLAGLGFLVASISMFKILPMLQILKLSMRPVEEYAMIRGRYEDFEHFFKASIFGTEDQLSLGVGVIPAIMVVVCLVVSLRKGWRWILICTIYCLLCLGPLSPVNISKAIWSIPVFHSMVRQAEYFNFYILFSVSILGGIAVSELSKRWSGRTDGAGEVQLTVLLIVILNIGNLFYINYGGYKRVYEKGLPPISVEREFYHIAGREEGNKPMHRGAPRSLLTHQYYNLLRNVGTLDWDMDIQVIPENAVPRYFIGYDDRKRWNPSYRGEFYFVRGGGNSFDVRRFTANRIDIDAFISSPDILVINQNYHRGWRTRTGEVIDYGGLLGVSLDGKGLKRVVLKYCPIDFLVGLGVSTVALFMTLAFLIKRISFLTVAISSCTFTVGATLWGIFLY